MMNETTLYSDWMPSMDYIATNFKSTGFVRNATNIRYNNNQIIPTSLSYDDAPLKYILPDFNSPQFNETGPIGSKLPKMFLQLLTLARKANKNHFEAVKMKSKTGHIVAMSSTTHDFSFDWVEVGFWPQTLSQILSIGCIQAPDPLIAKKEIISKLPATERKAITSIDSYIITPEQSRNYLNQKIIDRIVQVMNKITTSFGNTKSLSFDAKPIIHGLITTNKYKMDTVHETGLLIHLFLMLDELRKRTNSPFQIDGKSYITPPLYSTICNFHHFAVVEPNFDQAMANLLNFNYLSLLTHCEQVIATKLRITHLVKIDDEEIN